MRFISKLSDEQWTEARRLRGEGVPFKAIAERFGISSQTLRTRSAREGWPSPKASQKGSGVSHDGRLPQSINQVRRLLARRLLRIIDLELTLMEQRMKKSLDDTAGTAATGADATQVKLPSVESIIKTIGQVTELDTDTDRGSGAKRRDNATSGSTAGSTTQAVASEADVFRREIAERLEKLLPPS